VRRENVYWARHNVDLVRMIRSNCAEKYTVATKRQGGADAAELQAIVRRILDDFKRVKGLNGFKDRAFVRGRAESIVPRPGSVEGIRTGRAAIPAADLQIVNGSKATLVDDKAAVGGKAIRIDAASPDAMRHCIRLTEETFGKDKGARLRVRVHARVERTGVATGTAFAVGTCDLVTYAKRDIRNFRIGISKVAGDGYAWYDVDGTWCPAGSETLWVSNGDWSKETDRNPCVKAVYVDQIEISRTE